MSRFWIAVWSLSISLSTVSLWRSDSIASIAFIWDMVIGEVAVVDSGSGCLVGDGLLMSWGDEVYMGSTVYLCMEINLHLDYTWSYQVARSCFDLLMFGIKFSFYYPVLRN